MGGMLGDDDDIPFAVHVQPTLHVTVDTESSSAVEAQARAVKAFAEFVADANERDDVDVPFEVERLDLGGVQPDVSTAMKDAFGVDDEHGVPPEDTELGVSPKELDNALDFSEMIDEMSGGDEGEDEGENDDDDDGPDPAISMVP